MFRKMTSSDLDEVLEIEKKCFYTAWTLQQYQYELNQNPYANLWVLIDDSNNKIIGYYDLWVIFERAEIASIAVNPDYQKQGYGSKLMQHLHTIAKEQECESIALEVRVSNKPALALYQHYDFSVINTKPGYYETKDGYEDAYFMMKGI